VWLDASPCPHDTGTIKAAREPPVRCRKRVEVTRAVLSCNAFQQTSYVDQCHPVPPRDGQFQTVWQPNGNRSGTIGLPPPPDHLEDGYRSRSLADLKLERFNAAVLKCFQLASISLRKYRLSVTNTLAGAKPPLSYLIR
jgi:hypothetical protein